jgi:Predicted phosphohydrolases|nr:metallophosphoesterase [uncultured Steroidobacter sp.]
MKACTILHVSDLHHGRFYGFASTAEFLARFENALKHAKEDRELWPDLIVATGDLSSIAEPWEFSEAAQTLQEMLTLAKLPPERLIVCPGNHDVSWSETQRAYDGGPPDRTPADRRRAAQSTPSKLKHFLEAFGSSTSSRPSMVSALPRQGTPADAHSIHYFAEFGMIVIALNSSIRECHLPESHYGYIGEEQLRMVSKKLDQLQKDTVGSKPLYRVVLCHHPLFAPDDGDGSGMRDPIHFNNWIEQKGIHLVLHGHQHYHGASRITAPDGSATVIGAGSTSVRSDQRAEAPLSFNLIRVKAEPAGRTLDVYRADFRHNRQSWEVAATKFVDTSHELVRVNLPRLFERSVQIVQRRVERSRTAELDVLAADMLDAVAEALEWADQEELIALVTRQALSDCHTIFAIDVCGPRAWVGTGAYRYLAPQVKRYLTANVKEGKWNLVVPGLLGRAMRGALRRACRRLDKDGRTVLTQSATQFDNKSVLNWRIADEFSCQFARILLWTEDELRSPVAQAIAAIHNAFHVPLFFLPTPLKHELRNVDYIMFLGRSERLCLYGERDDGYKTRSSAISTIENVGNYERHFTALLKDPNLLFALDAIELNKAGVTLAPTGAYSRPARTSPNARRAGTKARSRRR